MPYNEETGEQLIEVRFKDTWYGDILRKPGIHLISIEWKDKLPKTAEILSVLEEDEFEEDTNSEEEEIAKHAHGVKPVPLSDLAKVKVNKSIADKKPKRQYRRKTQKDK